MATINLVTGYRGEAHVKSEEDALLNSFILGQLASTDLSIINLSDTFGDTDCDIDCDCVLGGRLIRTDGTVNLTFTKPSSGYYRYDGIYIMYKKTTSGVESAEILYCEGTESQNEATAAANMGYPPTPGSVVRYEGTTLYTIIWDNAQTKTVLESVKNPREYNTYSSVYFKSNSAIKAYKKNGFITLSIKLVANTSLASVYTLCSDNSLKPAFTPIVVNSYKNTVISVSDTGEVSLECSPSTPISANEHIFAVITYPCAEV